MLCPTGCKNIALPARHLEEEATKRKVARAFLPPPPSSECGPYLNSPPNPVRFSPPEELWTPLFALHDPIEEKLTRELGKGSFPFRLSSSSISRAPPRLVRFRWRLLELFCLLCLCAALLYPQRVETSFSTPIGTIAFLILRDKKGGGRGGKPGWTRALSFPSSPPCSLLCFSKQHR